ncbi:MAG: trypsin-like peptidase domain-containing protein [Chloroflexi bacterium]|nr:trypsin-like peptidase domain-containing protein [Chloroflexota bacterium]MCH8868988.1 trypsin-like peptidase domain-containing protein [Chloroflexota bacterium]MCH9038472.1 trypsin-like peptidase domain-containing protein [Chloroflexota bacterium]
MSEILSQLSKDISSIVEGTGKAIVRVEARRRMPATGIIWTDDGVIVTSHHVVERDDNIVIGLPDGSTTSATLVGRDPSTDVAVLRADIAGHSPAVRAASNGVKTGHLALALGRPGNSVRATLGMVNAVGKAWRTPAGGPVDRYIQTEVTMSPGFSGGPLVDASGAILGMNTSGLLRGSAATIPVETLDRVVNAILAHGKVRTAYLGVGTQPVRLQAAASANVDQETGLLIISVEESGPAERGGLLQGDTIVSLDGEPVRQVDDLLSLLSSDRVGKAVEVAVIRGGVLSKISVSLGERE